MMNPPIDPPPPPPDFPPPTQSRRSRRSRSERSSNSSKNTQSQTSSAEPLINTTSTTQQTRQQQYGLSESAEISASARTVTHENTSHPGNATRISEEQKTNAMHAMEMEDTLPIPNAHFSRFPRMPWSKHPFDVENDGIMGGMSLSGGSSVEGMYYGDVMSSFPLEEDSSIRPNYSTDSMPSQASRFQRFRQTVAASLRSSFSMKSTPDTEHDDDDDESLSDFKEWTPPDSAYGAAFPICGWVPKHYRRLIEATLIGLVIFVLVYFVVTTSIRLSLDQDQNSNSDSSASNNNNNFSDDDYYIDYDNYHYNNENDDVVSDEGGDADDDAFQNEENANDNDDGNANQYDDAANQNDDGDDGRLFLRLF